jgi:hypothetical protein
MAPQPLTQFTADGIGGANPWPVRVNKVNGRHLSTVSFLPIK